MLTDKEAHELLVEEAFNKVPSIGFKRRNYEAILDSNSLVVKNVSEEDSQPSLTKYSIYEIP